MQKTQKENRLQGRKNESKPNVPSDAGRVPRGQSCCLLVRSVLWYVQLMDQQKHDTVRPGGREENKRKEDGRKLKENKTNKAKQNQHFSVQMGQG